MPKSKKKASIDSKTLYEVCVKYSKEDDLQGLLKELKDKYKFSKPKGRNILQRISPFLVRTGKQLVFPSLAQSGDKGIRWSSKGIIISWKSEGIDEGLYREALAKRISYSVIMHDDYSLTLKPLKKE
jgi:hypothetical protein